MSYLKNHIHFYFSSSIQLTNHYFDRGESENFMPQILILNFIGRIDRRHLLLQQRLNRCLFISNYDYFLCSQPIRKIVH